MSDFDTTLFTVLVLEEMNKTIAVLDHTFPTIFGGVMEVIFQFTRAISRHYFILEHLIFLLSKLNFFQIYENWQLEKGFAMKFGENQFKVPATEEVMTRLRSNFSIEYEFYEFCKKRLDRQYKSLMMARH